MPPEELVPCRECETPTNVSCGGKRIEDGMICSRCRQTVQERKARMTGNDPRQAHRI